MNKKQLKVCCLIDFQSVLFILFNFLHYNNSKDELNLKYYNSDFEIPLPTTK